MYFILSSFKFICVIVIVIAIVIVILIIMIPDAFFLLISINRPFIFLPLLISLCTFLIIRHRLAFFEAHKNRCPITMVKFNPMGNMMFYAMSYDWCKGVEFNDPKVRTARTYAFA